MAVRKALFRFVLLILFIPVGLLLVLHFFGKNRMEVPNMGLIEDCDLPNQLVIIQSGIPENNLQKNQLLRINKNLSFKGLVLNTETRSCMGDTISILLIDKEHQLRGAYYLDQAEINRFFAELDILLMNESYGEGVSR
jgi:hypothetical protein